MCGIAGIVLFDSERRVDRAVLDAMTDRLAHRGPDARGTYVDGSVGLGHRRLSILDLSSSANQPMRGPSSSVITFNGEIYNFRELRADLERRGRVFRTTSDTEVLLAAYEERGPSCVRDLVGMFAFAIWDPRRRTLFCARDRLGQKPFFYAPFRGGFAFASEISALLENEEVATDLDPSAIHHYLTLHYVPSPMSAFRGVRKLPPAHTLTLRNGHVSVERYWEPSFEPKRTSSVEALAEEAWDHIARATESQMVSDVPVGAFLSGGKDSPAIVAAMARRASQRIKTFTVSFEEPAFDESRDAAISARHLGSEHFESLVTHDATSVLPKIVEHHGEPFADPSSIPTYCLSKLAREHVTVALSGDGGDEAFGGYSRYGWEWCAERLDRLPAFVRRSLERAVLAAGSSESLPGSVRATAKLVGRAFGAPEDRYLSFMCHFTPDARWDVYTDEFRRTITGPDTSAHVATYLAGSDAKASIDRCIRLDLEGYLADGINAKVDIASMMHSLEVRAPFLDHRLVEFAARLPESLKQSRMRLRVLYSKAVASHVPAEILRRKKRGLTLPVDAWLKGPMKPLLGDIVTSRSLRERGHIRPDVATALLDEHFSGAANHGYALWNLLVLELWMRSFVDAGARRRSRPAVLSA